MFQERGKVSIMFRNKDVGLVAWQPHPPRQTQSADEATCAHIAVPENSQCTNGGAHLNDHLLAVAIKHGLVRGWPAITKQAMCTRPAKQGFNRDTR